MHDYSITKAGQLAEAAPGLPRPDTKVVMLVSAGLKKPTYTLHVFMESRRCTDGIEFIFQCSETHATRRFGLLPASARERGPNNF